MCLVTQSCRTLCNPVDGSPPGSSVHGDSPDKSTGVDCQALLQGIFPIQGSNPGLPHCRQVLNLLSHQGSPLLYENVQSKISVAQSCPTLWDSMDSSIHGIFQARVLEWVAISFSRGSFQPRDPPKKQQNYCWVTAVSVGSTTTSGENTACLLLWLLHHPGENTLVCSSYRSFPACTLSTMGSTNSVHSEIPQDNWRHIQDHRFSLHGEKISEKE